MQSTEDFDLISELRKAYASQSKDAAYRMFDNNGVESDRVQFHANLMYMAADALAAERDRADRAEAVIANAPHSVMCEDPQTGCTCWKSEATA